MKSFNYESNFSLHSEKPFHHLISVFFDRQLQTTNVHLRQYDHRRPDVQMQKNQFQCSQLLFHNQELKAKCDVLQEKLDNLERNNIRLIQRWTQQVRQVFLLRFHFFNLF